MIGTMNPGNYMNVMAGTSPCKMCDFEKTELRHRVIANGTSQVVYQCLQCGRSATNPLPKSSVPNYLRLPKWDDSIAKAWDRKRHAAHVQAKQEDRAEFFKEHDAYLRTPAWKHRRELVLKRAKGICEGCGEAPATEVHHLTYENWKAEFLFELVALCHDCHDRLHIAKAKAKAAMEWQPE
jgi:hypothetical protein